MLIGSISCRYPIITCVDLDKPIDLDVEGLRINHGDKHLFRVKLGRRNSRQLTRIDANFLSQMEAMIRREAMDLLVPEECKVTEVELHRCYIVISIKAHCTMSFQWVSFYSGETGEYLFEVPLDSTHYIKRDEIFTAELVCQRGVFTLFAQEAG